MPKRTTITRKTLFTIYNQNQCPQAREKFFWMLACHGSECNTIVSMPNQARLSYFLNKYAAMYVQVRWRFLKAWVQEKNFTVKIFSLLLSNYAGKVDEAVKFSISVTLKYLQEKLQSIRLSKLKFDFGKCRTELTNNNSMLICNAVFINKLLPVMFFEYGVILNWGKSSTRRKVKFFFFCK